LEAPGRNALIDITKEYHDITCGEGSCIVYKKKKYPFRVVIEPVYTHFFKYLSSEQSSNIAKGGHLYFWIPGSSEKLYIKTGLLYTDNPAFNHYQIPFQFEYVFDYKIIKPKFDFGVNWHIMDKGAVALLTLVSGVCYVKLTNWVYLDFDISSDLFFFNYESELFETFAIRSGLYIKLYNSK
jgi:hypothetical protein